MGQYYNVIVKMKVKDADGLIKKSVDVFKTECPEWFDKVKDKIPCDTVYGCVAFALAANQGGFTAVHKNGITTYKSSFKATYSWQSVLEDWFDAIALYLKDGSSMLIYPDSGRYEYSVRDGIALFWNPSKNNRIIHHPH